MEMLEREYARVAACLKARLDRGTKADAAVEDAANKTVDNIVNVFIWFLMENSATSGETFHLGR